MSFSIDISEEAGVRTLHFGSDWIQGAMRIARPWRLELDYTREMMASLLLRDDARFPRKVLLIGLGAASLTKFLYRYYPLAKLTAVEIEPRVVAAARQFFKLPEDPLRLNIVIADGAQYIAGNGKTYDLILVDGYDADAHPGELDMLPFYQMCRARLNHNGVLTVNLLGRSRGHQASLERIKTAFDGRALALPPCDSGNVIAMAATGDRIEISISELTEQALELKQKTGLNLLPTLTRLEQAKFCSGGILAI
ncbi:fused MFS/spermidine synthase [Nitrosomonas sp. Is35]|uniref:fused MFS/spermidine synthase n=1 Tax=unclassified Nitrosomonas TaxID=2609265 RepID=UPI00294B0F63|nr:MULTISPECIES: fused MFS/spermidine synthase [unclassified Nitrosomonas]MDV6341822.1 fused MFS/spermidine synthase [Nitrosomonas sp. Is24]MDV6346925.1 fused MFS/spermidine synthase [Nitrosomonas sp. Is35]